MFLENLSLKAIYIALWVVAIGCLVSISFSSLAHPLIFFGGGYFLVRNYKSVREISPSTWCLLGLIGVSVFSVIANWGGMQNPWNAVMKQKYFIAAFFCIFGLKAFLSSEYCTLKRIRLILNAFFIATSIATLMGLIGLYTGYTPLKFKAACHPTRNCGLFGMYMTYGYGIHFVMIILVGMAIYARQLNALINKHLLWFALLVNFVGLYTAFARGTLLSFLIALPFFFIQQHKKLFLKVIIVIFSVSALSFVVSKDLQEMFLSQSRQQSNQERMSLYKTAWAVFKEKPLLGIGFRNFEPNVLAYKKKYNLEESAVPFSGHAHNNFFEYLASTGLLGFLFLVLFHAFWFREMLARNDIVGRITIPFIVALFVSGQVQYTLGDGENLHLIMLVYALSQAITIAGEKKNEA